jgi:hypothetical protein
MNKVLNIILFAIIGLFSGYLLGICISTVINREAIHNQIEEEIFNNTYGKNITVTPNDFAK